MDLSNGFLKRHSLIIGLLLMFLLTWPTELANSGVLPVHVPFAVGVTLGWGLSVAALIMTGLTLGREAVIALLKRFLIWRVSARWYLVAFLLFPAVFTSAVLLNASLTRTMPDFSTVYAHQIFGASASLPVFVLPFFLFDLLTNGEEMGWRGYVLPRLQAKHSALVSSLIVGVIWGFWHLPKYLGPAASGSFAWLMVKVLADGVIYTWLYNNTNGSLLLAAILHTAGNTAGVFLPMASTASGANLGAYITAIAVEILVAIPILMSAGASQLSRSQPKQVQV